MCTMEKDSDSILLVVSYLENQVSYYPAMIKKKKKGTCHQIKTICSARRVEVYTFSNKIHD